MQQNPKASNLGLQDPPRSCYLGLPQAARDLKEKTPRPQRHTGLEMATRLLAQRKQ